MARRSGQNGYIEKKGNAYVVRFWMDVPGQEKRAHKSVRICPGFGPGKLTKPERDRRAREIIAESGADTEQHFNTVQAVNLGTTFQQQADWWMEHAQNRKRRPVKAGTASIWKSRLNWINPRIGKMPLASVNNGTAKMLVHELAQAGIAPQTISGYLQVVKQVVASAINDDGEPIYPRKWNHEYIDLPEIAKQNTPTFTPEQVTAIIRGAEGQYRVLYAILAGTGLRIGEALGLEASDVSPDGQTITIRQSVWEGRIQSPKTRNAFRQVDIDPSLANLLLEYIGSRTTGFVFQSDRGTALRVTNVLQRSLHPILADLGLPKSGFHAFRRFRVTHLRKQRVPEDLLRYWIGHADKSITDGYSKLKDDVEFRREVANTIALGYEIPAEMPAFVPNVPQLGIRNLGCECMKKGKMGLHTFGIVFPNINCREL